MTERERYRFLCIARNIRNHQSRAWNRRTANWVLLKEFFGLGATSAYRWCDHLGINPDEYEIKVSKNPPQEATDET
jgi:hypothetical protein